MSFNNRITSNPGIIQLKDVTTGEVKTYELILADNPSQEGTPITAETLEQFKQEILDNVINLALKGEKGDTGDPGAKGKDGANGISITNIRITKV